MSLQLVPAKMALPVKFFIVVFIPFIIMTIGNINYAEPFLENVLKTQIRESYIPNFEGNIKFDNISFKYENSPYLFENFSLDIKKGERIAIIGQTGKGKSTLVKILLDFYNINKGNIYLDGVNYKDIPDSKKRELGGPVTKDKAYLVGEVGPEVFIPKVSGKIVSNDDSKIINLLLEANPNLKGVSPARAEKILRNRFPDYFE